VHEFALPHGMLAIWITPDCRRVGANVPLGRLTPFAKQSANGRYLRFAAGQADVSRMMLRHLRSIRLIRAELHLCLLC
jgi:hypothetical protein